MSTLFVTGTDTGVGKTLITKALIEHFIDKGLTVAGMKPVAAGAMKTPQGLINEDAEILLHTMNASFDYSQVNPYVFEEPIAPHIAANHQNVSIDVDVLNDAYHVLASGSDKVIVEGAGGWQVPLNSSVSLADWVASQQWPLVLVVGIRLGCINHAQLTCLDILRKKNPLLGWIANKVDPDVACEDEIIQYLESTIQAPLLGRVPFLQQPEKVDLKPYLKLSLL